MDIHRLTTEIFWSSNRHSAIFSPFLINVADVDQETHHHGRYQNYRHYHDVTLPSLIVHLIASVLSGHWDYTDNQGEVYLHSWRVGNPRYENLVMNERRSTRTYVPRNLFVEGRESYYWWLRATS